MEILMMALMMIKARMAVTLKLNGLNPVIQRLLNLNISSKKGMILAISVRNW